MMLRYIHLYPRYEKRLNALKQSEKMAVSAAKKADAIVEGLLEDGFSRLADKGKFSRHGEARIRNCIKFDIGKGYRVVCVKENDHLFFLFIGTHDDCATWIENNRNFRPDPFLKQLTTLPVRSDSTGDLSPKNTPCPEPDYEDILLERITEKDLRYVFRGLTAI